MNFIDVSHNQGLIDWFKVKQDVSKPEGVYIKSSQGVGYKDPMFDTNSFMAHQNGLKVGYYHFASLNSHNVLQDSADEANYFASVIAKAPKPDLPLALDVETNDSQLASVEVLKWITNFIATLATKGYTDVVIYSYSSFLDQNLPHPHTLGSHKLWLAAYTPKAVIPKGWANYWLWQYSQEGKVAGIKTAVDLSKQ